MGLYSFELKIIIYLSILPEKGTKYKIRDLGFFAFLRASQDLAYILFWRNVMKTIFCISLESNYFVILLIFFLSFGSRGTLCFVMAQKP
jgi:hypothetical protein